MELTKVTLVVRDYGGEVITLAGRAYEVVDLPGHSPVSIGLTDRDRRLFFTGDAVQARGTAGPPSVSGRRHGRRTRPETLTDLRLRP